MNKRQISFFHKPRTMEEILKKLFKGDAWAANKFQNDNINSGRLEARNVKGRIVIAAKIN